MSGMVDPFAAKREEKWYPVNRAAKRVNLASMRAMAHDAVMSQPDTDRKHSTKRKRRTRDKVAKLSRRINRGQR